MNEFRELKESNEQNNQLNNNELNKLPEFFIQMLNNQYDEQIVSKIIDGYSKKRYVTFRVNTIKADVESIENVLKDLKIDYERVGYDKNAFVIKNVNESFIEDLEIYKEGKVYLQSLSSMLPPLMLEPKENEDILDMTAAPGGKTTQIAALTNNKANITACEMNKIRAERLKYNVEKQGASSVYIMNEDARRINDFFSFDRILLDAPCSGSGTLDISDRELKKTLTPKLIEKCQKSQLELLKKAIKILKPGHQMIYSTCSILACENEQIIEKALKGTNAKVVPIDIKENDMLKLLPTKIKETICVMPNKYYEGFFVAKIIKEK